ncbi:MAG: ATP-binding cassette domain-containing protein [Firmicutes bacterium]|nr:ATP-binding cassette domain-containing protein [Bacillota bacterium]
MITVNGLSKMFKRKKALDDVTVSFAEGMYGLLGPNGAGKTTLMRSMLGLYPLQRGDILYNNVSIKKDSRYLKNIGYLPQKFGLFKELTVYEMMEYFATLRKIKKEEQRSQIEISLEQINLTERMRDKVGALSGGMVRRLGIAQTLLGDSRVIIVDEPTAGLDPEERVRFKNLLATIKKGRTIIISTHIVEDVEALCDQIVIIDQGKIVGEGDSASIRKIAQGRVYHVTEAAEADLVGDFFVEKRYTMNGENILRVISNETQPGETVQPTIEDGYLCRIKRLDR